MPLNPPAGSKSNEAAAEPNAQQTATDKDSTATAKDPMDKGTAGAEQHPENSSQDGQPDSTPPAPPAPEQTAPAEKPKAERKPKSGKPEKTKTEKPDEEEPKAPATVIPEHLNTPEAESVPTGQYQAVHAPLRDPLSGLGYSVGEPTVVRQKDVTKWLRKQITAGLIVPFTVTEDEE